jgi:hypothetical protein
MSTTSMDARARALEKTQAWLTGHAPAIVKADQTGTHVDAREGESEWWRVVVEVPHPGDEKMKLSAAATGTSRAGALELAVMELRGFVTSFYENPQPELRRLLQARMELPYRRSADSIERAVRCLRDRQSDVSEARVGAVGARVTLTNPTATIGDVVAAVLDELATDDGGQLSIGAAG